MAKYANNEQYEKDKDLAIAFCLSTLIKRTPAEIKQMQRIVDLLNQSKWVGLQEAETFKRHVFNAIFDAVNNHGVVADKAVVAAYTKIAYDDFSEEMKANAD